MGKTTTKNEKQCSGYIKYPLHCFVLGAEMGREEEKELS